VQIQCDRCGDSITYEPHALEKDLTGNDSADMTTMPLKGKLSYMAGKSVHWQTNPFNSNQLWCPDCYNEVRGILEDPTSDIFAK